MKEIAGKYSNIRLIESGHRGKPDTLNLGIEMSKYDYILTIDSDTIIHKNFIKEIIRPFKTGKVGATNGMALIHDPSNLVEHFQEVEYLFNNLIRNSFSRVFNNGIWFFGASACFDKKVLKKAGLFRNASLTEDMDISLRIFKAGYQVLTVENAVSYTKGCRSLKELFRQRLRWFTGGLQCSLRYRNLFKKNSFAIKYLFIEKYFWALYSLISLPIILYQIYYWMPGSLIPAVGYLFRWFSIFGPLYVIYKIPDWGLSMVSLFGVLAGIISAFLIINSIIFFKSRVNLNKIVAVIFYFPYTVFLNLVMLFSFVKFIRER